MREHESLQRTAYGAGLAAIVVLAIALRCGGIARESAWYDEVLSLQCLESASFSEYWACLAESDPPSLLAPAYFSLEYGWARMIGTSVISLRAFSLVFGILIIPLFARLGRRLAGGNAGLMAALCLAGALPHIYYAQEIRMYAMVLFLTVLSVESLLCAMEGRGHFWWLVHGLSNALLLLGSIFTLGIVLVEGGWLLCMKRGKKLPIMAWGIVHGVVLAAFAAWYAAHHAESAFWMPLPTWREWINTYVVFAGGRFSNDTPVPYLPAPFSLEPALLVFFFCCGMGAFLRRRQLPEGAMPLLLGWLIIPPLLLFGAAVVWKPCFLYRYVLYASFPLYLFAGIAFAGISSKRAQAGFLACVLILYGYQNLVQIRSPFRPDYRAVSNHVLRTETPRTASSSSPLLILKDPLNTVPMRYLGTVSADRFVPAYGSGDLESQTLALLTHHESVFVLFWRWDRLDAYERFLGRHPIYFSKKDFGGMPPVSLYMLSPAPGGIMLKK